MKTTLPSKKQGSVLVLTVIFMVAFTLMVSALLQLGHFNEMETIKQLKNTQAHWLAEAGLERALSWAITSKEYRDDLNSNWSAPFPDSLGTGDYEIIAKTTNSSDIVIRSTGTTTNGGLSDSVTVQLSMSYRAGPSGAIIGLGSDGYTYLDSDVKIYDGDVYRNGIMEIDGAVLPVDSTLVYATDTLSGGGTYTEGYLAQPEVPILDEDDSFADLISDADNQTNKTFTGTLVPGVPVLIHGNYILSDNISGSGTLVVSSNLTFNKNDSTISDNVDVIVGGNIEINQHTTFGNNIEIFSQDGNIVIDHDIEGGTVAFIAANGSIGHITADYNNALGYIDTGNLQPSGHTVGKIGKTSLTSLFYAAYDIIFAQKGNVYGAMVAGRHVDLGKGTGNEWRLTYDDSVYTGWNITYPNEITITNGIWQVVRNP